MGVGARTPPHQPAEIDALLDPQFFEFGASGRRLSRDDILASLPMEEGDSIGADDIAAVVVADGVVLVTYVSDSRGRRCNRSSIWRRTGSGWQCFFHQGTPIHAK
jgi:hypothetical protein